MRAIDELIADRERTRWTKQQLKKARGAIVYIYWGSEGEPLYVGRSHVGLARPLNPQHGIDPHKDEAGDFEFICCKSNDDADALEIELIRALQPKYNLRLHAEEKRSRVKKRLHRSMGKIRDGVYANERKEQFYKN